MKLPTLIISLLASVLATSSFAQQSTLPTPRNTEYDWMSIGAWYRQHGDDVEAAAKGEAEIVFCGDSITQGWEWAPCWQREFAKYKPVNLGVGGDRTENLLWRLQNGGTGKLRPKVVVLLIGVNNFGQRNDTPQEVFAGVKANIQQIRTSFPEAKILTLGVFPWGESPDDYNRNRTKVVNQMIATLADDTVTVMDVGHVLLEEDGTISKEIMGDFLHPTHEGYERVVDAILPRIHILMK